MRTVELELEQNHMATTFSLTIACVEKNVERAEKVLLECHREISQIEKELSEFLPESPVYQLNHSSAGTLISVTPHLKNILRESEYVKLQSQGAFDHLSKSTERGKIQLSFGEKKISKNKAGIRLGFGAIGKGYALDRARLIIETAGFQNYFLNAGGSSLIISGFNADSNPWKWAWSWAREEGNYLGKEFQHHSGKRVALGVSGNMEQGKHIINPSNAEFSRKNLSAIVANELASRADGFSTALFVKGWKNIEIFQDQNYFSALALIDNGQNIRWNGSFQEAWGPVC